MNIFISTKGKIIKKNYKIFIKLCFLDAAQNIKNILKIKNS